MRIRTYGVVRGVMLKHPPTRLDWDRCQAMFEKADSKDKSPKSPDGPSR